jgi:hypothetical protein
MVDRSATRADRDAISVQSPKNARKLEYFRRAHLAQPDRAASVFEEFLRHAIISDPNTSEFKAIP